MPWLWPFPTDKICPAGLATSPPVMSCDVAAPIPIRCSALANSNLTDKLSGYRPLQGTCPNPWSGQPCFPFCLVRKNYRHGLRMNCRHNRIRFASQERKQVVNGRTVLHLADAAPARDVDSGEEGRSPVFEFKPGITARHRFREAVERHEASIFRTEPPAPVRRSSVADVRDAPVYAALAVELWRARKAPTCPGQHHAIAFLSNDRCVSVRVNICGAEIAGPVAPSPIREDPAHGFLRGRLVVEVAHGQARSSRHIHVTTCFTRRRSVNPASSGGAGKRQRKSRYSAVRH